MKTCPRCGHDDPRDEPSFCDQCGWNFRAAISPGVAGGDGCIYHMVGRGVEMHVFSDKVELTPKGVVGVVSRGLKGTKTIPFVSITAIQHKRAGFAVGYLQFSLLGGQESKRGVTAAVSDENTFAYANKADDDLVHQIKMFIEQRMGPQRASPPAQLSSPAASPPTFDDIVAQIERFAELKERGLLTAEEFAAKKKQLLGL